MWGSLIFVFLLWVLIDLSVSRFSMEDSYQPISNHRSLKRYTVPILSEPSSLGASKPDLNLPLSMLKPIFLLTASGSLAYEVARRLQLPSKVQSLLSKLTKENNKILEDKIREMEGIIIGLRNSLNEQSESYGDLKNMIVSLESRLEESIVKSENTTEQEAEALASVEDAVSQLSDVISMDKFSSLREVEAALMGVEDRLERESAAAQAGIEQLREDIPQQLGLQGQMVTRKIEKFKQDLRALIERLGQRRQQNKEKNSSSSSKDKKKRDP